MAFPWREHTPSITICDWLQFSLTIGPHCVLKLHQMYTSTHGIVTICTIKSNTQSILQKSCANDDSQFAECTKRFHIGKASDVNVNLINLKQINVDTTLNTSILKPILLLLNLLWVAFNRSYATIFALSLENPLLQFHVYVTKGCRSTLSACE